MTLGIEWGAREAPLKKKSSSLKYRLFLLFKYFYDEDYTSSTELLFKHPLYPVIIIRVKVKGQPSPRPSIVFSSVNLFSEPIDTSDNPIEVYSPIFLSVSLFLTEFLSGILFSNFFSAPSRVFRRELFHILFHLRCLV